MTIKTSAYTETAIATYRLVTLSIYRLATISIYRLVTIFNDRLITICNYRLVTLSIYRLVIISIYRLVTIAIYKPGYPFHLKGNIIIDWLPIQRRRASHATVARYSKALCRLSLTSPDSITGLVNVFYNMCSKQGANHTIVQSCLWMN